MLSMFKKLGFYLSVCALGTATAFSPGVANAAPTSATGPIKNVTIRGANFAIVSILATPSGSRPSCHNGGFYDYAFDLSTTKGKALLSTAQAAMLAGKNTTITGSSSCTTVSTSGGGTIETLSTLSVGSIFD
jgi:hypothetical protein